MTICSIRGEFVARFLVQRCFARIHAPVTRRAGGADGGTGHAQMLRSSENKLLRMRIISAAAMRKRPCLQTVEER